MKDTDGIQDFEFVNGKKHPKVRFQHNGKWATVVISMSARTSNQSLYMRNEIKRIIRGQNRVTIH